MLCFSYDMGMDNLELGLVQAEKAGEVPQTARSWWKPLQATLWRHERNSPDG